MKYRVLRAVFFANDRFDRWVEVGRVNSMSEARARFESVLFGHSPVLERL